MLALWARVLVAVPGARLLLRYKGQFLEPALQRRIVGVLAGRGVGADRLLFPDGATDRRHHLAIYHVIAHGAGEMGCAGSWNMSQRRDGDTATLPPE
ncbi:hypothetical protein [Azospirillum sp.]|uniref:hypothetical protein n=1 Tax=Azospirillum sp. TaxID=34012 RepID=UPI002605D30B|nr:hypothetical protein [Azospirillum sp.]